MNESGVRFAALRDVARITKGKKPKDTGSRSEMRTIPYINIRAFENGQSNEYAAEGTYPSCTATDCLLVWDGARSGLVGRGVAGYIGSTLAKLESSELMPGYLFYFLRSKYGTLNSRTKGIGIPHVDPSVLVALEVPIRVVREQDRIVAEIEKQFSRLDEAVANLKRVKANLKRYKAAVLKAAVEGRLVPTEAELARREGRSYETGAQLLQRILDTRRSQWKGKGKYKEPAAPDTGDLHELPEGWVWASVESLSMKVADGVHKKPNYLLTGIPFVTVRNLTAGTGVSFDNLNYVSAADHAEFCKRTNPERGDILISKDGTLGVIRLVDTDRSFSIFVSVALVKPVTKELSRYLVTAFESPVVQRQMVPKGSGLQHIHLEDLRADCIPLPPLFEQRRIVAEVDRRLSLVRGVETEVDANLKRAEGLRQSVLRTSFAVGALAAQ